MWHEKRNRKKQMYLYKVFVELFKLYAQKN